jgi:predicted DNA-binding transcriptional regulator AlpA
MATQARCVDDQGHRPAPTRSLQSIPAFCADNGISRSLFYRLVSEGRGPRVTKVGRRTLISSEAAQEWRHQMEATTQAGRRAA